MAFAAGNAVFSYFLTALGFTGLLLPSVLWAVFSAGLAIVIWQMISFRRRKAPGEQDLNGEPGLQPDPKEGVYGKERSSRGRETFAFILLLAIVGFFLLAAVFQALAPPYVRDSLVYHLLCPKEFLRGGEIRTIEGNLYAAFPKGHEVIMTLLLSLAGDRAAQGFSIFQHLATAAGIFGLIRWMTTPWVALFCAVGYATVPPAIYFSGCGYVEPALVMAVLAAVLAITFLLYSWNEISNSERIKGCLFLGFTGGWMVAVKYTGLIYLGLIGFLLLWNLRKEPTQKALLWVGLFTSAALPGFCWMIWNWHTLGNPVYPFGWVYFGGRDWDASRATAMSLYFDFFGMGTKFQDYLLLPWRLAFSGRFDTVYFDGAVGPFLLFFLIFSFASSLPSFRPTGFSKLPKGFWLAILASSAFFIFGTQQARFWLPTHLLLCISSAPALENVMRRIKTRKASMTAFSLLFAFCLGWNLWYIGNQLFSINYYKVFWGMETKEDFLRRKVPGFPAIEFMNSYLPESSRTLCVWTGGYGYYFDRRYYTDTFVEDYTIKKIIDSNSDGRGVCTSLRDMGFTHLFVRLPLFEKNMEVRQNEIFRNFLQKQAQEIFRSRDFAVFSLLCKTPQSVRVQ